MPQLLSRRDDSGWLTPSMADVLLQSPSAIPGEETLRTQVNTLQRQLAELGTPVRITDVRPSPSHTLFTAQPERAGNRQPVSPNDVRRSLGKLDKQHEDWSLGLVYKMPGDNVMGILLRTGQNMPLPLRQIIISNTYLNHPSTQAVVFGVTLQQHALIRDLNVLNSLIVIGPEQQRQHALYQLLLPLLMLNTPAELRLALVGPEINMHRNLSDSPHTLGKLVDTPEAGIRLLDGMLKETERRRQYFLETNSDDFDSYNAHLANAGEAPLPRIIILFDSLSDANWQAESEQWIPTLCDLLLNGGRVGVHVLVTADETEVIPEAVAESAYTQFVTRSAGKQIIEGLDYLHHSALRFIDGFLIDKNEAITPLEFCDITAEDMQRLVTYWQHAAAQRVREEPVGTGETATTTSSGAMTPPASTLAKATFALAGSSDKRLIQQAEALAAYLGWLGVGPLRDVLGLSAADARAVLEQLQESGVLESGSGPILRFNRLTDNPLADE
ncbi:MAG: hypothetical protein K8L99_15330 [Anaerolineae bacterium]|nr:hypothetical protein [Anaerolineae bacterium]